LLAALVRKPSHIFSRSQLRDLVWGPGAKIDDRTIDVHIGRLRKALGQTGRPSPIRTARGAGYFIVEALPEISGPTPGGETKSQLHRDRGSEDERDNSRPFLLSARIDQLS